MSDITTGIVFIDDLPSFDEARVFIRVDFNVPLEDDGTISDDARIRAALPTIEYALERNAKVILASHLGRPKGKRDERLSMVPVGQRLSELLGGKEVIVPEDNLDEDVHRLVEQLRPGHQVLLLENTRFDPGEKKGDREFAQKLADLADYYVNDAFGTSHRAHASVYQMVEHFDRRHKAAGFLIKRELEMLGNLLQAPAPPFVAIMGGAKVSDKLGVLESLIQRVDAVLIGGAMAYTFLKAQGHEVGASLVEEDMVDTAASILQKARRHNTRVHLPRDHRVARSIDASGDEVQTTESPAIPVGMSGFDIGPKTIDTFSDVIRGAGTVFWNGPMGVFEKQPFAAGTLAVARVLARSEAKSVVGGGDSAAAARDAGVLDQITHVSTGGGASLEFVEGKPLPGVEALRANHPFDLG